jgi:GNAT superfamily N-acetyltransferase
MTLEICTLRQHPDLRGESLVHDFSSLIWPEFLLHDRAARLYYAPPHFDAYQDYAFAALRGGTVVGRAFSVPFDFGIAGRPELPDGGWDEIIRWAHDDRTLGRRATAVSALEIGVLPKARGRGLSWLMLEAMRRNMRAHGFHDLFAPVRPTAKARQPFMPMRDYVAAVQPHGLPQDPWLRTHVRAGGSIEKIAPCAMTVVGTIAEWTAWTGVPFERSGLCAVEAGIAPVHVCLEQDHAVYVEAGVWVHHRV